MIWWLKRHRALTLACALTIYAVGLAALGGEHVALPSFSHTQADQLPIRLLLPLGMACVVLWALGPKSSDEGAVRRVNCYRLVLPVTTVIVTAVAAGLAYGWDGSDSAWGPVRNIVGFLGIAMILWVFARVEHAAALTAALVLGGLLVARTPSGTLLPGAWPLADGDHFLSWAIALACFIGGVAAFGVGSRQSLHM
ncbi:hypothetical protein [Natronoglycomyces albus]|uniref:Uncharacterized protein n=1 Tax=Natronoglycomyces albus TaxID=2811108 RepID=A0A895XPZ7_9ACTN|nr:hypothetical protein [Natronoglycomyces albus]QSB04350.1 hypothetical protein JQS30_11145 [Natronoglycomyces albus]